jgi:selenide,water dikinase
VKAGAATNLPRLVLVGGGHAHVQVLRSFAMDRPPVDLTVVLDRPVAIYSGMVPGLVSGRYQASELEIDVLPLARRAGARVILARAEGFAPQERRLRLEGRPAIPYDLISWNVGSVVAGLGLPGICELAVPTRPIGQLVRRIQDEIAASLADGGTRPRILVVGGGAGGVELAFCLRHRLAELQPKVSLVHDGAHLLPGFAHDLRRRVQEAAARKAIAVILGRRAIGAERRGHERVLLMDRGEPLPFDLLIWVTGAVATRVFQDCGLELDKLGFLMVRPTLQAKSRDDVFAVGDCATLLEEPGTPKAGIFAVREGPVLIANLRAILRRRALSEYKPQRKFLALLNLGDGSAIGGKWGFAFEGTWVMRWKDRIDRKFMERFQVLDEDGAYRPSFPPMPAMGQTCGGCAAKVGPAVLERALARMAPPREDSSVLLGLSRPDDAAAWRTPGGDVLVATIDAFKPFCDDAFLVGRVAATNAVSDAYAKGARPRYALAMVVVPEGLTEERQEEELFQVLSGLRAALDPLGVTLVGGHSGLAAVLLVGLAIFGDLGGGDRAPNDGRSTLLPKGALRVGQRLVLTKALGTGVLFHAAMMGQARGPWLEAALASVLRSNVAAAAVAREVGATAVTDITGFGLLGHVREMVHAAGLGARLDVGELPALPGAEALLARGSRSDFHDQNSRLLQGVAVQAEAWRHPRFELLVDPQTSGGLLLAIDPEQVPAALAKLRAGGDLGAVVGEVLGPPTDGARLRVACSP